MNGELTNSTRYNISREADNLQAPQEIPSFYAARNLVTGHYSEPQHTHSYPIHIKSVSLVTPSKSRSRRCFLPLGLFPTELLHPFDTILMTVELPTTSLSLTTSSQQHKSLRHVIFSIPSLIFQTRQPLFTSSITMGV